MNLTEFLALGDADLPSVVKAVRTKIGLRDDDVLLAVGSLVEGLGNSKSDVDLMLITPRNDPALLATRDVMLVVGRCLVDVRPIATEALEALFERVRAIARIPWSVTLPVKFLLEERLLLHRVVHGAPLYRGRRSRILKRLPARAELARLKLQVARHESRTIQVDMAGLRDARDHRSLVFAAQEVAGHTVDALAAGHQLTNPQLKWRSRMLDALPADWEKRLAVRPTGLTAGEVLWRLLRAPEHPSAADALEHALRITTFARAVFHWAEQRLITGTGEEPQSRWRKARRRTEQSLPHLDLDVDFAIDDGRVILGRLNAFGDTVALSSRDFTLALLFDGITTRSEAASAVREAGGVRNVDRVRTQLEDAGFLAASPTEPAR